MSPDEAFAKIIGLDPVKGLFFLPSGKVAVTRAFEKDGMYFRASEGKPRGSMIVAIDVDATPALVGAVMAADCGPLWDALGDGLFRMPLSALMPPAAVLGDAIACGCGAWPAPYGDHGVRKCGGCFNVDETPPQETREAEGGPASPGLPGI